jgi:hypothetical protein
MWSRVQLVALLAALSLFGASVHADSQSGSNTPDPLQPSTASLVRNPPSLGTLDTGLRDAAGASVGISCETCHDPNHPDALARKRDVPKDFHSGISVRHGSLGCPSCHAPDDSTRLRLADGETIAMREVMQLCGQCHGPKQRDFWKGSHGGGRGYWDRSRGPWVRNSCVACHAAHEPAYPTVMPAPPPNDRFLPLSASRSEDDSHE